MGLEKDQYTEIGKRKVDMKKVHRVIAKLFKGAGMHNADLDATQRKLEKQYNIYDEERLTHRNASETLRRVYH